MKVKLNDLSALMSLIPKASAGGSKNSLNLKHCQKLPLLFIQMQMDRQVTPSNTVQLKKLIFQVDLLMMGASALRCRQRDNFEVSAQGHLPPPHPVGQ